MFEKVELKLQRAEVCLSNLRWLDKTHGPLAHVKHERQQELRCYVECFYYETVSAQDFFLQGVNERYGLGLASWKVKLKSVLEALELRRPDVKQVLDALQQNLEDKDCWLWQVNNYRNCATHRELLRNAYAASSDSPTVRLCLPLDPEDKDSGETDLEVLPYCEDALRGMRKYLQDLYDSLPA